MSEIHHLPIVDARRDSSPEAASLGDADLLQVGDLARKCDKTVRAIHHYENLGLLKPYKRSKGRYRLYAPDAVARVRWIGKLTDLGMTLAEIVSIVSSWERAGSAPEAMAEVDQVFRRKLEDVRAQLQRLASLERELQTSIDYLDGCDVCEPTELIAACSDCTVHDRAKPEPALVAGLYANR